MARSPKSAASAKDVVTRKVLQNKQVVSAGMVLFGVLAAGSFARRKYAAKPRP